MGYSPWGHKESDTTEHTHTLREVGGGPGARRWLDPPRAAPALVSTPLPGSGAGSTVGCMPVGLTVESCR